MSHMELLGSAWQKQEKINAISDQLEEARSTRDEWQRNIEKQRLRKSQFLSEQSNLLALEEELNQKIQSLSKAKERTSKAMETGAAYDYATAETQVKAYADRIDALEDEALTCMEQLENLERDLGIATESIVYATKKYGEALAELNRLQFTLEPEQESLENDLKIEIKDLPREWEGYFERMRHKHKKLVVVLRGRNCGHCGMEVPAQSASELVRLQRPFSCRLCKAILVSDQ